MSKPFRTPEGVLVQWPEGLPRDFAELADKFGAYIERRVKRLNKVKRNNEDLSQHIWQQLIISNVLEKFVVSAVRRVVTMPAFEAIAYLGISKGQWCTMVHKRGASDPWLPGPVKAVLSEETNLCVPDDEADPYSMDTLYSVDDIVLVDEVNYFRVQGTERKYIQVSVSGFKAYLQRAVHNHFCNFCRTNHRRNKEQLLTPSVVLSPNTDGTFRQAGRLEEFTAWEASLVAVSLDEGGMLDLITMADTLREAFRKANLDINVVNEVETVIDEETGETRTRPTAAAQRALEIVEHLSEGHSIREAVHRQARGRSRLKAKTA